MNSRIFFEDIRIHILGFLLFVNFHSTNEVKKNTNIKDIKARRAIIRKELSRKDWEQRKNSIQIYLWIRRNCSWQPLNFTGLHTRRELRMQKREYICIITRWLQNPIFRKFIYTIIFLSNSAKEIFLHKVKSLLFLLDKENLNTRDI